VIHRPVSGLAAGHARLAQYPARQHGYDDAQYRRPELRWTQRDFVQTQAMVEDRYLYDPATQRYTVPRFLDDLRQRYGGIDSVLLWPVYPNIGIDDPQPVGHAAICPAACPVCAR
jgi:hypothetical protein